MNMLTLFAILGFVISGISAKKLVAGDLSPYDMFAGGDYTATGTYNLVITAVAFNVSNGVSFPVTVTRPSANIQFCISNSTNFVTMGTPGDEYGTQYINQTHYCYQWLSNPNGPTNCACNSIGLAQYATNYKQAKRTLQLKSDSEDDLEDRVISNVYAGAVIDAGQRRAYSGTEIVTNINDRILHYSLAGTVWANATQSVVKTFQRISMEHIYGYIRTSCPTTMPAQCNNPTSFDAEFQPLFTNAGAPIQYTGSI